MAGSGPIAANASRAVIAKPEASRRSSVRKPDVCKCRWIAAGLRPSQGRMRPRRHREAPEASRRSSVRKPGVCMCCSGLPRGFAPRKDECGAGFRLTLARMGQARGHGPAMTKGRSRFFTRSFAGMTTKGSAPLSAGMRPLLQGFLVMILAAGKEILLMLGETLLHVFQFLQRNVLAILLYVEPANVRHLVYRYLGLPFGHQRKGQHQGGNDSHRYPHRMQLVCAQSRRPLKNPNFRLHPSTSSG